MKESFDYNKKHFHNLAYKQFQKNGCKKILDLGCGFGYFVGLDPQKITGLDRNPSSIEVGKKKGLNIIQGDVIDLSMFEDDSFDGVYSSCVIEHLYPHEAYKMLQEIDRVLKVNGTFVLFAPLMHKSFYHDFTHIKPYPPRAIAHYLNEAEVKRQSTLNKITSSYKKINLIFRYRRFRLITNWAYKLFGLVVVNRFVKNAYVMTLKKTSSGK